MKNWGRKIIYLLAVILVLGLVYLYYEGEVKVGEENAGALTIGDTTIVVELADDHVERAQGLSGRNSLKEEEGMFFVFPESGVYPFWMKDMNFPIDIVWIDKFMKIVDITKNISPDTYPQNFSPKAEVLYALEVNAGFADRHKASVGSEIKLEKH